MNTFVTKDNASNLDPHHADVHGRTGSLWHRAHPVTLPPRDDDDDDVDEADVALGRKLLHKLRWVTLGYHYDWTRKVYDPAHHTVFPGELDQLMRLVAQALGFASFRSEAAIVNFYRLVCCCRACCVSWLCESHVHPVVVLSCRACRGCESHVHHMWFYCTAHADTGKDSTLAGHSDYSEPNCTAPLLSFSLGCSATFLLGGPTRDEHPLPVLIERSVILMCSKGHNIAPHPHVLMYAAQWRPRGDVGRVAPQLPCCAVHPPLHSPRVRAGRAQGMAALCTVHADRSHQHQRAPGAV